jgi:hypothetical protein
VAEIGGQGHYKSTKRTAEGGIMIFHIERPSLRLLFTLLIVGSIGEEGT